MTSQIQLEYLEELKKFTKLQDEVYIEVIRCKKVRTMRENSLSLFVIII